jgi:hypothetical protein
VGIFDRQCHKDRCCRCVRRASRHVARRNVLPQVRGVARLWPARSARRRSRFDHREETMAVVPVVAPPQRRGRDRARTAAPTLRTRGRPQPVAPSQRLRPSEALRAWNRERIDLVFELRCECGQPTCTDTVPAVAETHRGSANRFLVTPAHLGGGVVVRAADRFFVVDSGGRPLPQMQRGPR